ncbi:MAG TPA: hypothetical protein VK161_01460, partial [Flavobacterium sp.]|nr:hypothetical protein [Flavobacterium sp.]
MKKNYFIKFVLFLNLLFSSFIGYSQSAVCNGAEPVCGGGGFSYTNSTGQASIGSPDCLGSAPNPAWFYFQVSQSGPINIMLNQGNNAPNYNNQDVDFICWGPFTSTNATVNCNNLYDFPDGNTSIPDNVVACSYSAAAVENFSIPNALAGQVYVLLITNFSNQPGQIEFTQTNINNANAGLTDCELLLTLGPNITICQGQQAILTTLVNGASDANAYAGATFTWTSTAPGFVPPTTNTGIITVTEAGTYTVTVTKPGFPANTSTSVVVSYPTPPPFAAPNNIQQCSNQPNFNLTPNLAAIFNGTGLNPADFAITFHTSLTDAEGLSNPIGNPTNYPISGSSQTIYMGIEDNSANGGACIYTASFTIEVVMCQLDPGTPPNLILCDDVSNDGFATFDLTPQTLPALNGANPSLYTISYHISQADADSGANPISPINSYTNTSNPQTIYVRMEENANPLTYGTDSFQLIVNQYPIAGLDGAITVCETSTTAIDLFSLITGEQSGGVWTQNSGSGG